MSRRSFVNTQHSPIAQPEHKHRLLIVDDEPASMRALCDTLEYEGYQTYGFTSPAEALAAMRERSFDLLLADLQMPGTNGIDLMKSAQLIDPTLVAVIMTGHGALETAIAAMKAGALDYIQKPIKLATTLPVLERALAVRQLRIEKKRLEENVRERTEELKIANRELEAFSYSVSHDLRAPLRAVSVFTQSLLSDHVGHADDEGRRLLQNVNAGAAHMDRLITDLLRLSQLNRQALHKQPVRFGELAQRVIDDMAQRARGPRHRIRDRRLPDLAGGPGPHAAGVRQPDLQRHQVHARAREGAHRDRLSHGWHARWCAS